MQTNEARRLDRREDSHADWVVEQRFHADAHVRDAARRVVTHALVGCVQASAVERAERVMSALVADEIQHGVKPSGHVLVRLRRRFGGCRLEVESDSAAADPPRALDNPVVRGQSERWGFEGSAGGGTRVWAELSYPAEEYGDSGAARRAGVPPAATEVHVVPNERAATWQVYDARAERPLSEHASETEAEAAARACARIRQEPRIVIHDRYHRTHEAPATSADQRS
jgi:hypothetical protein